jgi:hypothetical protein
MTKEDRYSHLGDSIEGTDDAEADGTEGITVRLEDGDEETVLRFDPEEVSAEELRAAIEAAPDGTSGGASPPLTGGDPGQLALELSTLGPRLALKSVESLVDGLQVERDRD